MLLAKVPQIPQIPILYQEIPSRDLWDLWDGRDLWDIPCPTLETDNTFLDVLIFVLANGDKDNATSKLKNEPIPVF